MVEGTPLLREHLGKTWIEGSNPSVSAKQLRPHLRALLFVRGRGQALRPVREGFERPGLQARPGSRSRA